jgi:hypothetical protein
MNNERFIDIDDEITVDNSLLRQRKASLVRMIEAINELSKNKDWQVMKDLLFDGLVDKTERNLLAGAKQDKLNDPEIYRLQGQLIWAKRYSDLYKLAETFRIELGEVTKRLNQQ